MHDAKPIKTLVQPGLKLSKNDGDPLPNPREYRSVVGALQYVTLTRPDIAFAINQVCKFMQDLRSTHWIAVKRILHFLKGTITHGLHFCEGPLQFTAYSDANWAKDPDDRRSTSSYAIFFFFFV